MLVLGILAFLLLLPTLLIHCWQHFEIGHAEPLKPNPELGAVKESHLKRYCRMICCIRPIGNEAYFFFPLSFLFYVIFVMILTVIFCINEGQNIGSTLDNVHLFTIFYNQEALFRLHSDSMVMDGVFGYVSVYGVMILSIWESLFSFYRFYATWCATSDTNTPLSTRSILVKFCLYIVIYAAFYATSVHIFYWIFPVVVSIHIIFNFFCNIQFAKVLTDKYRLFAELGELARNADDFRRTQCQEMLETVRYVERASLFCAVLQSIYLTAFIVLYHVTTTSALTLLWSINCLIFTFNFSRNREFLLCRVEDEKSNTNFNTEPTADADDITTRNDVNEHVIITVEHAQTSKKAENGKGIEIKTNSEETVAEDDSSFITETIASIDVLSTCGFCSKRNLNEINLLLYEHKEYILKTYGMTRARTDGVINHMNYGPKLTPKKKVVKAWSVFT